MLHRWDIKCKGYCADVPDRDQGAPRITHFEAPRCRPGSPQRAPWNGDHAGWGRAPSLLSLYGSISPSHGVSGSPSWLWRVRLQAPGQEEIWEWHSCVPVMYFLVNLIFLNMYMHRNLCCYHDLGQARNKSNEFSVFFPQSILYPKPSFWYNFWFVTSFEIYLLSLHVHATC